MWNTTTTTKFTIKGTLQAYRYTYTCKPTSWKQRKKKSLKNASSHFQNTQVQETKPDDATDLIFSPTQWIEQKEW